MNRKLVGALGALAVVAVGIWFFFIRDRGDATTPPSSGSNRTAEIEKKPPKPSDDGAPRGGPVRFQLDIDPAGPLTLEGQVVGPDGKGVAGAEVELDSVPKRTAKSEDDGTFQFDKVIGRVYNLTASTDTLVGGPVRYKPTATSDPVVIRLGEGAKLVVTVVDDAKQPLAGATVRSADSEKTVKTDAKGEATLTPVHPGWVGAQAVADGYAPNTAFTTVGSAGATGNVTIVLKKGYAVSGRVVDEAGKPIASAKVGFAGGQWGFDSREDKDDRETDSKGQFTIPAVAAGEHVLHAIDGEHAPAKHPISVIDKPVTGVEIVMKEGGRLAGKVVDGSKVAVPFATVRVAGADDQMFTLAARQATTDKDGSFEIRGLARTKLAIRAESETAASAIQKHDLTDKASKDGIELLLDQTGSIAGMVVDEKGTAVAEVTVNAFPDIAGGASIDSIMLGGMTTATTDGGGAFVIRGLPDGAWRISAARSHTRGNEWGRGTPAKTGDKDVKIVLPAPGAVKGKIVIAGGGAPKTAIVRVGIQPGTPANAGSFEIKEVVPGDHALEISGPEFTDHKQIVKVQAGQTLDVGEITVQRGRRFSGKVVDGDGRPVEGARVKVGEWLVSLEGVEDDFENTEMDRGVRSGTTNKDGTFELVGVPEKGGTASASHPKLGSSSSISVPAGTNDILNQELALRGFGTITGTVTSKGKPVPRATISLTAKGGGAQMSFAQTDDKGVYKLSKVAEGAYVVQAMQSDAIGTSFKATTAAATVTAGKESKVDIEIPVGNVTLTVELQPLAGAKFDLAQVFLFGGSVAYANAKQLTEAFTAGGAKGMKIWFGKTAPMPDFAELVPGDYSVCSIPITGDVGDAELQRKLQENMEKLKVYCKAVKVTAAPVQQKLVHQLPSMEPI